MEKDTRAQIKHENFVKKIMENPEALLNALEGLGALLDKDDPLYQQLLNETPTQESFIQVSRYANIPSFKSTDPKDLPSLGVKKEDVISRVAIDRLCAPHVENVVKVAIRSALQVDQASMKLLLDRWYPPRKGYRHKFNFPICDTPQNVSKAYTILTYMLSEGEISGDEALVVSQYLDARRRAFETAELADELAIIKAQLLSVKKGSS